MKYSLSRLSALILTAAGLLFLPDCGNNSVAPPTTQIGDVPSTRAEIIYGAAWSNQFTVTDSDSTAQYFWQVVAIGDPPHGNYGIDSAGVFVFTPAESDSGRSYNFRVLLSDDSELIAESEFGVKVRAVEAVEMQIETLKYGVQGSIVTLPIVVKRGSFVAHNISFRIGYDGTALALIRAVQGTAFSGDFCVDTDVSSTHGTVHLEADSLITDWVQVYLTVHSGWDEGEQPCVLSAGDEVLQLRFRVTDNQAFACSFRPVKFLWKYCGDNSITTSLSSILRAGALYDHEWGGTTESTKHRIPFCEAPADPTGFRLDGLCGDECSFQVESLSTYRLVLQNGGVSIACADSIDTSGDNFWWSAARPHDFNRLTLYQDYFFYGEMVFAAFADMLPKISTDSDLNQDGHVFTIADLVYLMDLITDSATPPRFLNPYERDVELTEVQGSLYSQSTGSIGGFFLKYLNPSGAVPINNTVLKLTWYQEGDTLRLVGRQDPFRCIAAGENMLLTLPNDAVLTRAEFSDCAGNLLQVLYRP